MAGSLIAWEIGFGGVRFLVTHGLTPPAAPAARRDVFRGVTPSGSAVFREGAQGTPNVFGGAPGGGGKVFR